MKKGEAYIGTSGWNYRHWKGTFYPEGLRSNDEFNYFISQFSTVELNNSFYMLPPATTFTKWRKAVPKKFLFSVKVNRFITHNKKLKPEKESIRKFFSRATKLQETLGPVLFQLPPKWNINADRLASFLPILPKGLRYTFEFRNHSWYDPEIYKLLKKHNCAFCIYELEHHLSPLEVTADFVYVRLHGPDGKYKGNYSAAALKKWAKRCKEWMKSGLDVFFYFDNDQAGYAAFNALSLKKLVEKN